MVYQLLFCCCFNIIVIVEYKEKVKYYLRHNKCYRKCFQIIVNEKCVLDAMQ